MESGGQWLCGSYRHEKEVEEFPLGRPHLTGWPGVRMGMSKRHFLLDVALHAGEQQVAVTC